MVVEVDLTDQPWTVETISLAIALQYKCRVLVAPLNQVTNRLEPHPGAKLFRPRVEKMEKDPRGGDPQVDIRGAGEWLEVVKE